jgi:hypothetical protein
MNTMKETKEKKTIQIRMDRELHRQLKLHAFNTDKSITYLATQMILYCLVNKVSFLDEIETITVPEDIDGDNREETHELN